MSLCAAVGKRVAEQYLVAAVMSRWPVEEPESGLGALGATLTGSTAGSGFGRASGGVSGSGGGQPRRTGAGMRKVKRVVNGKIVWTTGNGA